MITASEYPTVGERRESSADVVAAAPLHLNTGHNSSTAWAVKIYPDCGEASVALVPSEDVESSGRWERLDDEQREVLNWERANRRAAANLRRYMVSNSLHYMWVLTLAGEGLHGADGRRQVMQYCGDFARSVRTEFGVDVYAYSPELHPNGHGWHVNFFVAERLPHAAMKQLWGHGHVWVSDWKRKVKKREGVSQAKAAKHAAMSAARYAAKYAEKDWSREVLEGGAHRYERSEGHEPAMVEGGARTVESGLKAVFSLAGDELDGLVVVFSDDIEDYMGPPWVFVRWEP